MSELTLSREAKNALHTIIHNTPGIEPKDIAQVLGVSHKTVLNYANPNMETHLPSLKAFEAMLTYTENPAVLKVWAHKIGLMLVPVENTDGKEHHLSVLESLLGMNVGNGAANKQVLNALEDGVVTPAEMDETDHILEEMELKIQSLRKAMKGECAKYLSALQIEKA